MYNKLKRWMLEYKCMERGLALGTRKEMIERLEKDDYLELTQHWGIISGGKINESKRSD